MASQIHSDETHIKSAFSLHSLVECSEQLCTIPTGSLPVVLLQKRSTAPKGHPAGKSLSAPGVSSISPHLVPVAQRCLSSGQLQTSTGTSLINASGLCLNTFGGKKLLTHQPLVGGSNSQSFHSHPWSCPAFVQFIGSTSALQVRPCPWRGAHVRPRPGSATM